MIKKGLDVSEPNTFEDLARMFPPESMWNTDATHVRMIYKILLMGGFETTLEIGSHNGTSAVAFIGALNEGVIKKASFCDVNFLPRFHDLIACCNKPIEVTLFECGSSALQQSYDLVYVDGDHSLENVRRELAYIRQYEPNTVLAHDTNAYQLYLKRVAVRPDQYSRDGGADFVGPPYLMEQLKLDGYYVCEDRKCRQGEKTHRGLSMATRNKQLFEEVARYMFEVD